MKLVWSLMLAVGLMVAAIGAMQSSRIRLEGRLFGNGNDKGKAKWQTRDSRTQLQAELEVEAENLAPATVYIVTVGENTPWSVQTNAFGAFHLEQVYRGVNRPVVDPGEEVRVTDFAGNPVLSGTLTSR